MTNQLQFRCVKSLGASGVEKGSSKTASYFHIRKVRYFDTRVSYYTNFQSQVQRTCDIRSGKALGQFCTSSDGGQFLSTIQLK